MDHIIGCNVQFKGQGATTTTTLRATGAARNARAARARVRAAGRNARLAALRASRRG